MFEVNSFASYITAWVDCMMSRKPTCRVATPLNNKVKLPLNSCSDACIMEIMHA